MFAFGREGSSRRAIACERCTSADGQYTPTCAVRSGHSLQSARLYAQTAGLRCGRLRPADLCDVEPYGMSGCKLPYYHTTYRDAACEGTQQLRSGPSPGRSCGPPIPCGIEGIATGSQPSREPPLQNTLFIRDAACEGTQQLRSGPSPGRSCGPPIPAGPNLSTSKPQPSGGACCEPFGELQPSARGRLRAAAHTCVLRATAKESKRP